MPLYGRWGWRSGVRVGIMQGLEMWACGSGLQVTWERSQREADQCTQHMQG